MASIYQQLLPINNAAETNNGLGVYNYFISSLSLPNGVQIAINIQLNIFTSTYFITVVNAQNNTIIYVPNQQMITGSNIFALGGYNLGVMIPAGAITDNPSASNFTQLINLYYITEY